MSSSSVSSSSSIEFADGHIRQLKINATKLGLVGNSHSIIYNDTIIYWIDVLDGNGDPVDVSAGNFTLTLHNFVPDQSYIIVDNSHFTSSLRDDWSTVNGRIACEFSVNSVGLEGYLGSQSHRQAYMAIWSGSTLIAQFPVRVLNRISNQFDESSSSSSD